MKKSEIEGLVMKTLSAEEAVKVVAELRAAGVLNVDPEEPELPGRVGVVGTGCLVTADSTAAKDQVPMGRLAREAAARYNAWGRLTEWLDSETRAWTGARGLAAVGLRERVREYLQQEREKLR